MNAPVRTCVGCGRRDRQSNLLRVQFDADARLQIVAMAGRGRSAYVHPDASCRSRLRKSRLLAKSLRRAITDDHKTQVALAHEAHTARLQTAPLGGLTKAGA